MSKIMSLQEAVKRADADPYAWVRPVTWRGTGLAISFTNNVAYVVPGKRGGVEGMPTHVVDLVCDWEALEAEDVLAERYIP